MRAVVLSPTPADEAVRSDARRQMVKGLRAASDQPHAPVLLVGPRGAGRRHAARLLHEMTYSVSQPDAPLLEFRPETSLDEVVDLFGCEKPSTSGAPVAQQGLVERGHGGTLIIHDVADLSEAAQARLMRLLETWSFRRLEGSREMRVRLRVVAITEYDIDGLVENGRFRRDLQRRFAMTLIRVPSLASTPDDIAGLARSFLHTFARASGEGVWTIARSALKVLEAYPFPGNVRELRNVIEHAAILATGNEITERDIVLPQLDARAGCPFFSIDPMPDGSPPPLEQVERAYVARVLSHVGGRRQVAAQILGVSYPTFLKRLREIEEEQEVSPVAGSRPGGDQDPAP